MGAEPWIGFCHLRAQTPERERWIGDRPEAVRWLMLAASSPQDYAAGMRRALGRMGYDLLSVSSAAPADRAEGLGPLTEKVPALLAQVNEARPVGLGDFAPPEAAASWRETDWDEVLLDAAGTVWAVVDGVAWPGISGRLAQGDTDHACLYGTLDPSGRAMAPWLVRVQPGSGFAASLRAHPQGDHAFVLLRAEAGLDEMRGHLRRFTMMHTPHDPDAAVYFRFYDPRVMIDALETLTDSFRDSFTRILDAIILPLTPACLLPDAARLTGPAIDPLDDSESCRGRLLRWRGPPRAGDGRRGPSAVSEPEYAALSARMHQRAVHDLARQLVQDYGALTSRRRCLTIAGGAAGDAARFDMGSAAQVAMIARAQLLFGVDFDNRYPETGHFLNDRSLLAWQKKDRLADWFARMSRAHGLEHKEIA